METQLPEYQTHEEYQNRRRKLNEIKEAGIDPYPHKFEPTTRIEQILEKYEKEEVGDSEAALLGKTPSARLGGRLILFRPMGKNAFGQLQEESSRIQILLNRDTTKVAGLSEESGLAPLKFVEKMIDLGDLIGVEGALFRTHKGELTLFVKTLTLLCKTLLPLPDKHSGLADKGVRYRKRWLDLIVHPEVAKQLKMRSSIVRFVRTFFEEQGFLEVETPVLHHIYGGAEARPFVTELHALHQTMFLRIALEISLKKLMIGGLHHRLFEMSKVFRNEGIDKTHNPEFTMLEAYAAYLDYNDLMVLVEKLFEKLALRFFNSTQITIKQETSDAAITLDLKTPWKRLSMKQSLQEYAGICFDDTSDAKLKEILRQKTAVDPKEIAKASRGMLMAFLFEELVEEKLLQPHHIIDHPIETTPFCKPHRDPLKRKEGLVERFESFVLAREMCNAYTELNDPLLQRELFEHQAREREAGKEEAHPLDEEFLEAICQGMPPTGGLGIGIDRLVMLFTDASSIRDVIAFPLMKPESE